MRTGRVAEAREIFESMLVCRNRLELFSKDIDPEIGEHWHNNLQTCSLVVFINCAMRFHRPWHSRL
jgi:hypothetical protein